MLSDNEDDDESTVDVSDDTGSGGATVKGEEDAPVAPSIPTRAKERSHVGPPPHPPPSPPPPPPPPAPPPPPPMLPLIASKEAPAATSKPAESKRLGAPTGR